MKKTLIFLILFFGSLTFVSAETKRIISGNENAKITIIVYESLTCSHCANFHKDIYPKNKKYQKKINDVKNEKIRKSLLELTKVFKKKKKKFLLS